MSDVCAFCRRPADAIDLTASRGSNGEVLFRVCEECQSHLERERCSVCLLTVGPDRIDAPGVPDSDTVDSVQEVELAGRSLNICPDCRDWAADGVEHGGEVFPDSIQDQWGWTVAYNPEENEGVPLWTDDEVDL